MRSEQEMLDLILDTARGDARIRAVILNGSRANPNAPRDPFQDFDIAYLVKEVAPFRYDPEWIECFGELMILQMPEDMQDPPPSRDGSFSFLMQFTDGNRIDLKIAPLNQLDEIIADSLTSILLDKDQRLQSIPPPSEHGYLPQPPTPKAFADCCNEFWWVCPYVAKGLWRGETLYARQFLDHQARDQLLKMITWYAGTRTGFSQNPGKNGKYLRQMVEAEIWVQLMSTFSGAGTRQSWEALFAACDLFRRIATQVAAVFGFDYPQEVDQRVRAHLKHVRMLRPDAEEIY
jgi:aminoglycoside 6-adenylyltransferase